MADLVTAPGLTRINAWSDAKARAEFLVCCGSAAWAAGMVMARPFADLDQMLTSAGRIWASLTQNDWLDAFLAHPPIGRPPATPPSGRREAVRARSHRWSVDEQRGVRGASRDVLSSLDEGNRRYEERFGYIFIACATGRTATELLDLLLSRLANEPGTELRVAAAEQLKITEIRLRRLAGEGGEQE